MPDVLLRVESVDLAYGEVQVVYGASLEVGEGEVVGLVGGNGSGKSTILRAISGMLRPRSGRILLNGQVTNGLPPHAMLALGCAHVPMGRQLFSEMTVEENLLLGAYLPRARPRRRANLERVYALFPQLERKRRTLAGQLSGGEQQMLAIGRALMSEPRLLLLDEPSLGLAPLVLREVYEVIEQVAGTGLAMLLVEQNVRQVLRVASRTYVLENGRIVLHGPSAELMNHPEIRRAYLGL